MRRASRISKAQVGTKKEASPYRCQLVPGLLYGFFVGIALNGQVPAQRQDKVSAPDFHSIRPRCLADHIEVL